MEKCHKCETCIDRIKPKASYLVTVLDAKGETVKEMWICQNCLDLTVTDLINN